MTATAPSARPLPAPSRRHWCRRSAGPCRRAGRVPRSWRPAPRPRPHRGASGRRPRRRSARQARAQRLRGVVAELVARVGAHGIAAQPLPLHAGIGVELAALAQRHHMAQHGVGAPIVRTAPVVGAAIDIVGIAAAHASAAQRGLGIRAAQEPVARQDAHADVVDAARPRPTGRRRSLAAIAGAPGLDQRRHHIVAGGGGAARA